MPRALFYRRAAEMKYAGCFLVYKREDAEKHKFLGIYYEKVFKL